MGILQKVLLIGLAGSMGSLARYGMASAVQRLAGKTFPWGVFSVNMVGCFLFGLVMYFAERKGLMREEVRAIILVGFFGAFTTFSTFMYDSTILVKKSGWFAAMGNIMGQNVLGLICLYLGMHMLRNWN